MKRRFLSVLLIVLLVMSFIGCGSKKQNTDSLGKNTMTETPSLEPSQEPTQEPTQEPEPTLEPTPSQEVVKPPEYTMSEIEDAGIVDGLTYTNSLIGFSMKVPESWLVYNAEETYSNSARVNDGTEKDAVISKDQLNDQGVAYICYGADTQLSAASGTPDYLLVQVMSSSLFGGLDMDEIVPIMSKEMQEYFTSIETTCTISDPVKMSVGGQDVYQVSIVADTSETVGETTTAKTINQEYIMFMKNRYLVYMCLSTALEDSTLLAQQFIDSLSFQ